MADKFENDAFDVEKQEALDVESKRDLRSGKRRGRKSNPDQFDLFTQNFSQAQESSYDSGSNIAESEAGNSKSEIQQLDGIQDSAILAAARAEVGGRTERQANADEGTGTEGGRYARSSDAAGENAESRSGLGASGSVAPTDEAGNTGRGNRTGQHRRDVPAQQHAVGHPALEDGARGVGFVQVHGVDVLRHRGEGAHGGVGDGEQALGALAHHQLPGFGGRVHRAHQLRVFMA